MADRHADAASVFDAAAHAHAAQDWEAAVNHYTTAVQFFKRGQMAAACHDRKGSCLAEMPGQLEAAVACHSKALQLAPTMMSAWHNRGHAHMHLGDFAAAVQDLEKALSLEHTEETSRLLDHATQELNCPELARAAFGRALDAYALCEWNAAKEGFEEALGRRHSRPSRCYNGLGLAYTSLGQLDHALSAFDHAIDAEPDNPRAWHNRSTVKGKLGRNAESQAETMMASALSAKDRRGGHTGRTTAAELHELKAANPANLALGAFDPAYFQSLERAEQTALLKIMHSGIENPDATMGCYACQPTDYDRFKPFFQKALSAYHNVPEDATHRTDWSLENLPDLPPSGVLDLTELGLSGTVADPEAKPGLPIRVQVARNLSQFPLTGAMSRDDRCDMEHFILDGIERGLIDKPEYGGKYHSFTPGHSHQIPAAEYQALVKAGLAFQDMTSDRFLMSAGIASHWPYGRGVYISEDGGFVIWVGQEDHLKIMCMKRGVLLNQVFERLALVLEAVSAMPGLQFAVSPDYGHVTSCPTNLGTGMQASIMMKLPNLTMGGTDIEAAGRVGSDFGLTVRGVDGSRDAEPGSPKRAAKDGTVEVFPSATFCVTEAEIISSLYKAIGSLKKEEDTAEEAAAEARRLKANAKEMERHTGYMDEMEQQKMAAFHVAATNFTFVINTQ